MKKINLGIVLTLTLIAVGCTNTIEGQVRIQVIRGQITRVIRPADGWVNTMNTVGDEYFDITLRTFTFPVVVNASTKDNAAVQVQISATLTPPQDDEGIIAWVRKFGLEEDERWTRMTQILAGQMNTETKNAVANYEAYGVLANQEAIQKRLIETLAPILKQQLWLTLDSVQIIGRPDFADDRIESAASAVVANQKAKEAAEADLARARVEAEKMMVESKTFANPAMLELEKLKMRLQIEQARAEGIKGHQGPLTIVNGGDTQLQLKGAQ